MLEGAMKNILLIALLNHPEYAELDWEKEFVKEKVKK